jgi:hypothetical protein
MNFYSGSYFCTRSNWTGETYWCNNLVSINNDLSHYGNTDFNNLIVINNNIQCLSKKVENWLNKNIKKSQKGEMGWCIGDDLYRKNNFGDDGFSLFFYRRKDALMFIKKFSCYKKPTQTFSQNTYVRKKLDIKSNRLVTE